MVPARLSLHGMLMPYTCSFWLMMRVKLVIAWIWSMTSVIGMPLLLLNFLIVLVLPLYKGQFTCTLYMYIIVPSSTCP